MKVLSVLLVFSLMLGLSAMAAEEKAAETKPAREGLSGMLEAKGADAPAGVVAVLSSRRGGKTALLAANDEVAAKIAGLIGKRVQVTGEKVDAGYKVATIVESTRTPR